MIRRLGDGTFLDTATGMLLGSTPTQTQLNRDTQLRAKGLTPIVNRGQHIETVVAVGSPKGIQVVLQPRVQALAVDPFGTGMNGLGLFGTMSDMTKRFLAVGLIIAAAGGVVWLNGKMKKKA
jgi:hypothetical protein